MKKMIVVKRNKQFEAETSAAKNQGMIDGACTACMTFGIAAEIVAITGFLTTKVDNIAHRRVSAKVNKEVAEIMNS